MDGSERMSKSQTINDLLSQFKLDLNLNVDVLDMEINSDYDSFEVIKVSLPFGTPRQHISVGEFECYHFEHQNFYCMIVPENKTRTIIFGEKIDSMWHVYSYNMYGELTARS